MNALKTSTGVEGCRRWSHGLAALALAWGGGALAQDVVSVPAAHLQHAEGSVAYAPQGDKEWHDVQPRRVLKRGDRLWTDRGSRAEVQAGGHALRLNGETQIVLENVGDSATQLSLTQGTIAATVTHLNPGDSFEVGTPNLAFRARQPGDYRIDVDPKTGLTRIVVQAGSAVVYGEKGEALEVKPGQHVAFRARDLSRVLQPAFAATDDFDKWAGARKRGEPTVSMPAVAQAAASGPAASPFLNRGRDIVISGPPSSLPGAKPTAATQQVAAPATPKPLPATPTAPIVAPVAKAQPLPNVAVVPNAPSAATLRVNAPGTAVAAAAPGAAAKAEAEARTRAQIEAAAQAAHEQQERERLAQQRAEEERKLAAARENERRAAAAAVAAEAKRAESERRAAAAAAAEARRVENERRTVAAAAAAAAEAKRAEADRRAEAKRAEAERRAEAKRADDKRRTLAAKREDERRAAAAAAQARREQEQKRVAAAKRAEEERRIAEAKRAAEEKRLAALRKAEEKKIAEQRRQQIARLQDQARRDEQNAQSRREQARRAEDERREEQARIEDQARQREQARREEDQRRMRDQARREQQQRDEEVWLRQQQGSPFVPQPVRPAPMGVPARRVS